MTGLFHEGKLNKLQMPKKTGKLLCTVKRNINKGVIMEKTNVMRLLEQKKIKYKAHDYTDMEVVHRLE